MTALVINAAAAAMLAYTLVRSPALARKAIRTALTSFLSLMPMLLLIVMMIGLLFAFVPEESLREFLGDRSGPAGILLASAVGAILHIPALLVFPLAGSLIEKGASPAVMAGFITTLTMVGAVTLPLEIRELGVRFALWRNGLSLVAAVLVASLMGAVL